MIPLSRLLVDLPSVHVVGNAVGRVRDVVHDSRRVRPGDVFVAIPGRRQDGVRFARDAVDRGAVAVVAERLDVDVPRGTTRLIVPCARTALGLLAAARHAHPSRRLGLVGVTGTDGKTTTSALIAEIFEAAGVPTGLLSTVQHRVCGRRLPNRFHCTTPEAPELQAHLARVVSAGGERAVLELSSHGLAQERVAGCEIDVAVLTNLSPEHLDFHGTFEAYRAAKVRLFESLGRRTGKAVRRFGVVNADDPNAGHFRTACPLSVLSYGMVQPADVRARDIALGADRTSFVVESPIGTRRLETRLVGCFNVYNWLAAICVAIGQGLGWGAIERAAIRARPVRGRMQRVEAGQPFTVLVDFAHTPRALATVLDDCRRRAAGRVIVVFGHPGERYADNRPRLGAAAVEGAHLAIVTSDDSYGEDPDRIIDGIVAGARGAGGVEGEDFLIVPDRRAAIRRAVELARPGDLVLIAGRGHLSHREIGRQRIPFDDARVARELIDRVRHSAA